MKKIILIYLLVFILIIKISAQGDMSGNGLFVASTFNENGKYFAYVHKFMTKELVRKINIGAQKPQQLKISYSGKYIYTKTGTNFSVYNVVQNSLIRSLSNTTQILLANNGDFFIALMPNSIIKYDCITGNVLTTYVYPSKTAYELVLSPDDNYFAAKSIDRIFVYNSSTTDIKQQTNGFDIKFSDDSQFYTIISDITEKVRVSTVKLQTFYQERAFTTDVFFKNFAYTGDMFPQRSSLSPSGKNVAVYTAKGNEVQIYVFDTYSAANVWTINNLANTANELYPLYWADDNTLIASGQNLMAGKYFLNSKTSQTLGLRIDDFTSSPNLKPENQQKNRIISPDYNFVVIQDATNMIIRDSRVPDKKITYPNTEFVTFSPDGTFLFVKKDQTINAILTKAISQAIQENSLAKLYAFNQVTNDNKAETFVQSDAKPPKGYAYFFVNNTKQIVLVDTVKLHLSFRSVKLDGNNVELSINLLDANGNEFLGATDPSWKFIWCNLLLQNPSTQVTQINNFAVEEVFDQEPTAYALVLDQSGSMGDNRINLLQYGAWDLINNKNQQDAYALIKFDNHVKVEKLLTKDKTSFQKLLSGTGTLGFGGTTALIDATFSAANILASTNDFNKKSIILFTDGYENASFYNKTDLLNFAAKNNIQINVIGFGDQINEEYLKNIAYNTGGIYSHIYKTEDLRKIFRDIDFKRRHYYSIKFQTQSQGNYVAFLQLCQDLATHDSIWIPFDNSVNKVPIENREPVPELKVPNLQLTQFNKLKIPINPLLKPVSDKKINTDFGNIDFPNILFATASDKIVSSEEQGIDEIVSFMRKYPNILLEIHGHTDNLGTPEFNMDLSFRRAKAAKKLIVAKGIAPGRIVIRGFGDTKPIASNDTEEGKAKNRRIEFHIFVQ